MADRERVTFGDFDFHNSDAVLYQKLFGDDYVAPTSLSRVEFPWDGQPGGDNTADNVPINVIAGRVQPHMLHDQTVVLHRVCNDNADPVPYGGVQQPLPQAAPVHPAGQGYNNTVPSPPVNTQRPPNEGNPIHTSGLVFISSTGPTSSVDPRYMYNDVGATPKASTQQPQKEVQIQILKNPARNTRPTSNVGGQKRPNEVQIPAAGSMYSNVGATPSVDTTHQYQNQDARTHAITFVGSNNFSISPSQAGIQQNPKQGNPNSPALSQGYTPMGSATNLGIQQPSKDNESHAPRQMYNHLNHTTSDGQQRSRQAPNSFNRNYASQQVANQQFPKPVNPANVTGQGYSTTCSAPSSGIHQPPPSSQIQVPTQVYNNTGLTPSMINNLQHPRHKGQSPNQGYRGTSPVSNPGGVGIQQPPEDQVSGHVSHLQHTRNPGTQQHPRHEGVAPNIVQHTSTPTHVSQMGVRQLQEEVHLAHVPSPVYSGTGLTQGSGGQFPPRQENRIQATNPVITGSSPHMGVQQTEFSAQAPNKGGPPSHVGVHHPHTRHPQFHAAAQTTHAGPSPGPMGPQPHTGPQAMYSPVPVSHPEYRLGTNMRGEGAYEGGYEDGNRSAINLNSNHPLGVNTPESNRTYDEAAQKSDSLKRRKKKQRDPTYYDNFYKSQGSHSSYNRTGEPGRVPVPNSGMVPFSDAPSAVSDSIQVGHAAGEPQTLSSEFTHAATQEVRGQGVGIGQPQGRDAPLDDRTTKFFPNEVQFTPTISSSQSHTGSSIPVDTINGGTGQSTYSTPSPSLPPPTVPIDTALKPETPAGSSPIYATPTVLNSALKPETPAGSTPMYATPTVTDSALESETPAESAPKYVTPTVPQDGTLESESSVESTPVTVNNDPSRDSIVGQSKSTPTNSGNDAHSIAGKPSEPSSTKTTSWETQVPQGTTQLEVTQVSEDTVSPSPLATEPVPAAVPAADPDVVPAVVSAKPSPWGNKSTSWAGLFQKEGQNSTVIHVLDQQLSQPPQPQEEEKKEVREMETTGPVTADKDPQVKKLGDYLKKVPINNKPMFIQPRGLINIGNNCYINSILQILVACPPFYNLFQRLPLAVKRRGPSSTPMLDAVINLCKQFDEKPFGNRKIHPGEPFEPVGVYQMLRKVNTTLSIKQGKQEDAEEFLSCLLNGFHDEMIAAMEALEGPKPTVNGPQTPNGVASDHEEETDEWEQVGPKKKATITRVADFTKSPIYNIFGGQTRSALHQHGARESATLQPFFTVQLDIQSPQITSVKEALENFGTKEAVHGFMSNKTKTEVEASKRTSLEELPPVLILHLKQFVYDKAGGCQKLTKRMDYDMDLEISKDLLSPSAKARIPPGQRNFKLFAVIYHTGKEASGGHYISDYYHVGIGGWIRADDNLIKTIKPGQVLNPPHGFTPYLLVYRRREVPSRTINVNRT